jgi:lysophospholipase L1-like esterase
LKAGGTADFRLFPAADFPLSRRVLRVFLFPLLLVLVSCGPAGLTVPADHPALRLTGRWDRGTPAAPRASWPGFGVECGFTGSRIAVRMDDPGNYYQVEIDGIPRGVIRGRGKGRAVTIADDLPAGSHHLRLTRRNISFDRPTTLEGLVLEEDAQLLEWPAAARKKIEFIGDSYTVAEGNEATAASLPWRAKYPVTHTGAGYAGEIARAFDADYHIVSRSGSGVLCDYLGNRAGPMPERYGWTLMEQAAPRWDFRQWTPDLVVICLGVNDYSGLKRTDGTVTETDAAAFRRAYAGLLAKVRRHHPRVEIVALAHFNPWVREQVKRVVDEAGDRRLHYAQFDEFPGGYVADGHPTVATHRKMAAQILPQIEGIGGLRTSPAGR